MITRIVVKNFRGIAAREIDVPASGGIAKGRNGAGKSSILKAIRAALSAQDIGPDAIRLGADKAEILVDLDELSVRRAITAAGSILTVKTKEGDTKSKPQTCLTDLLGTSPLDPLDLFLAKKSERRAKILAALPVTADLDFLRKYVPALPDDFDVSGHGLDVIERLRAAAYAKRTVANASAKAARETAERTAAEASSAKAPAGAAPAMAIDDARASLQRASADADGLRARAVEATRAIERTAKSRAKIARLRDAAAAERADWQAPDADELAHVETAAASADRAVADLRDQLARAEAIRDAANAAAERLRHALGAALGAEERAKGDEQQAAQLEETIAEAAVAPVADEQIASADVAVEVARAALARSLDAERAAVLTKTAETLALSAKAAEAEAARLDTVVRALANDAPAALLDASGGIPGIAVEGDEILIDGVNLDGLSSAEQMRLAVEVARRANAKSKILVVDGLERLDPEQLKTFVKHATSDGWQLLATKVDSGDLVFDVIESEGTK